ncbi:MAG: UDP-N-acetylmuramoyl-L-alanyl-D-glutamate--2,6-diaminopimelate ligase [FCB group bacterium]|jgi:UDP-N-acetylmuramoyl-L-alanyl-D-glutamate--2,6-diaminopimelate ligase|nr:UDP-N-acetylmuramoyl-L-alanyl-D-glutamate--2,6-diaminopimelate ligase [FCB group bacterium]
MKPLALSEAAALAGATAPPAENKTVVAVTEDSRQVVPGALFVATQGEHVDGHDFAAQAVERGAVAIIGARRGIKEFCGVPYLSSAHPRQALGRIAHRIAGDPSRHMKVIGYTGTNGKSSSVLMTRHVLNTAGHPSAAFGTLGYTVGEETFAAKHTTPFGEELAEMFARAQEADMTHVAMEVSSHALEQERVAGIEFDVGVFTNLTQDHLDFHKSMDAYQRAKLRLFERIEGPGRFTVVNRNDPSAGAFIVVSRVPCYTFGEGADCRAEDVMLHVNLTEFHVHTPWGDAQVAMRLLGRHNVSNALGVIAVCAGLGVPLDTIAEGLESITVPGRFEHVDAGQDFQVIVDYAHTDDGLMNVLKAARAICRGRVVCVFGCGGDRDRTKRPKMARVAAELADFCIITSDNPRTEDLLRIIDEVEAGMRNAGKRRDAEYLVIADRATAIRRAIEMASAGDLILIAGKGHEDYQIIGTERIHFDDREVARNILEGR